ncbi:hypothetical protein GCM10022255_116020 [Dactylosporangium darangshiense]|uniref:Uncharacterized protein n=1 Tax=Dactylosporangium darangshiense TaxID=579108 RepID=A0ABP8DWL7_9ACTN
MHEPEDELEHEPEDHQRPHRPPAGGNRASYTAPRFNDGRRLGTGGLDGESVRSRRRKRQGGKGWTRHRRRTCGRGDIDGGNRVVRDWRRRHECWRLLCH